MTARGKSGVALDPRRSRSTARLRGQSARARVDPKLQQLRVRLEVRQPNSEAADTRATFDVGFFDFPVIDNTRLANGVRCSVTLAAFSEANADLATICFPVNSRASGTVRTTTTRSPAAPPGPCDGMS